tara:strand:- start:1108 stop:3792 length:2685 start_codon:yes stop_codon:yes gene_type:complete
MKNFPKTLSSASKREASLDNTRLVLNFKEPTPKKDVAGILKGFKLSLESLQNEDDLKPRKEINHTVTRFWVQSADGKNITDKVYDALQEKLSDKLDWIGPVYNCAIYDGLEAKFCPLPDVLLIEKSEQLKKRQDVILKKFKLKEDTKKSNHLSSFRYLKIMNSKESNSYTLQKELNKSLDLLGTIRFENMPMVKPFAATVPNDTLWAGQWNMTQINATDAWDISTGSNTLVICVLDEGCDLTHPDLQFSEDGINLGTMLPTGEPTGDHGTACAGIAAATFNNSEGVAGLAGDCLIMPIAFDSWTDVEVANGINYASVNGAGVISMSFGWDPWDPAIIDPEIQNAFSNDVVMCVATHNYNSAITYPATNPLVIACGASSTDDNRKSPTSPDGETWGSDFGDIVYGGVTTGVSVVAPGVLITTTDRQGGDGYDGGNYFDMFNGTSSATPLVAGLAALIRSQYPSLTNVEVRNVIERTAAKVGSLAYTEVSNFLNGTRNEEMGYGRIDAFQAVDFADVLIKDWSGDDGTEPSSPPSNNWWSYSDIVVRIFDDDVFNPSDPAQSKSVERGQTNFIYVRVTNNGPQEARNVMVDFRITPYIGLEFVYPNDWTLEDGMHVRPTPVSATFATIASGASVIAKFTISAAQTETLYGWQYVNPWHPCLLAYVTSDNDYAFASSDLSFGNLVLRKNNIAQRNLSVIDVLANASASTLVRSPFVAGNRFNLENRMFIALDRSKLPLNSKVYLTVDDDGKAFPEVDFERPRDEGGEKNQLDKCGCGHDKLHFLSRTVVKTRFGCCDAVLTLEKGSDLEFSCAKEKAEIYSIKGGNLLIENGKRLIEVIQNRMMVEMEKFPRAMVPMSVLIELPSQLHSGQKYSISISQLNENRKTVGGADTVFIVA